MLTADPDNAAKQDEQKKRLFEDKNMTHSLIFYLHCYCVCCVFYGQRARNSNQYRVIMSFAYNLC